MPPLRKSGVARRVRFARTVRRTGRLYFRACSAKQQSRFVAATAARMDRDGRDRDYNPGGILTEKRVPPSSFEVSTVNSPWYERTMFCTIDKPMP